MEINKRIVQGQWRMAKDRTRPNELGANIKVLCQSALKYILYLSILQILK